ncbi:hypothetical protein ES703_51158 [subsurface metagenome]
MNNSYIENSTLYGIYFQHESTNLPEYNLVYNNFFNNTINYYNTTSLTNYFNTTLTSGTNILGGPWIAGNYWAHPNGTGFSETCTDVDPFDGICDSPYNIENSGNYDYLPLVCYENWSCTSWSACSGGTQTRTCTDANSCGTINNRPALSQSCSVGGNGGVPTINIAVNPTEINLDMIINVAINQMINITNLGVSQITVSISQQELDNMIILNTTSLTLAAGETKNLNIRFIAPPQPGIYTGKIFIGNRIVLISLNVKTKLLLFDSNIIVLNKDYIIMQGDKLKTRVTLIPMGDEERLDVTLNYVIKDYSNKVYLTKSETVLVEKQINFKRDFDTGKFPLGRYIVGLELVYPGGVAPSSAYFEIIERKRISTEVYFYLIIAILLVLILITILLIIRHLKKKKQEEVSQLNKSQLSEKL